MHAVSSVGEGRGGVGAWAAGVVDIEAIDISRGEALHELEGLLTIAHYASHSA